MQSYTQIASTDTLTASLAELLNNDLTVMSCSSGTAFPTVNLQTGMLCFRTDLNQLWILKSTTPVWELLVDVSGTAANVASASSAGTANSAASAAALAGGVAGAIVYQTGPGGTGFSATGTAGWLLQSNGAGAPTWINPSSISIGTYSGALTSSQITTGLGYTPYNATNPSGFLTGITSGQITTALGYTPYNGASNPNGYITSTGSITGSAGSVTTFPGYQAALFSTIGVTNWTCPAGVHTVKISIAGGGGGAVYATNPDVPVYGRNGGRSVGIYAVSPGTVYAVTIGAGGVGTQGGSGTSGAGGTSSVGALISATGGSTVSVANTTINYGSDGTSAGNINRLSCGALEQGHGATQTTLTSAAQVWSITSAQIPGQGGTADPTGTGVAGVGHGYGGMGGAALIEYIG